MSRDLFSNALIVLSVLFLFSIAAAGCGGDDEEEQQDNPCDNVTCGDNANCVDGACVCDDGFEGDADTGCTPVDEDPCADVTCVANASCVDGACVCDEGYEGDPAVECTEIVDLCTDVTCGENASCVDGTCECNEGYEGNPNVICTEIVPDPCEDVTCGIRAHCEEGECVCDEGYEGDPNDECFDSVVDPCEDVTCGENAHCVEGACVCNDGFEGDPDVGCTEIDLCAGVVCGENAQCVAGDCVCNDGYEGDPDVGCTEIDPCTYVVCGDNAHCTEGVCECDDGFEGNPILGCVSSNPCEGVVCGEEALCIDGICFCPNGMAGDPDVLCEAVAVCDDVVCADNSLCFEGQCVCDEHYENYNPSTGCTVIDTCIGVDCDTEYSANSYCAIDLYEENLYECICNSGFQYNEETSACESFCTDDELEDNDDFENAILVDLPFTKENLISMYGDLGRDYDFFVAPLFEGDVVQVDVTFLHEEGDIDLDVYYSGDLDNETVSSYSTTDNEQIIAEVMVSGYFYLAIKPWTGGMCTNYTLSAQVLDNPCRRPGLCTEENTECRFLPNQNPNYECVCADGYVEDPDSGACVEFCPADSYEPNDEPEVASAIGLPFNDTEMSVTQEAEDWYAFSVEASYMIDASALAELDDNTDLDLTLYNASDPTVPVAANAYGETTLDYFSEEGGDFLLKLSVYNYNEEVCVTYDMDIQATYFENVCNADPSPCSDPMHECRFLPGEDPNFECVCMDGWLWDEEEEVCYEWCPDDAFEPNETVEEAFAADLPFIEEDLAVFTGNEDWFVFDVPAGQLLSIDLTFAHADGDIDMYLHEASSSSSLVSSLSSTDNESIDYVVEEATTFALRVKMHTLESCSSYDVLIEYGPDPCHMQCTGENQSCERIAEAPGYACNCDVGFLWDEAGTACVADPCEEANCTTDYSENSHCEIDWEAENDFVCVCDSAFAYNETSGVCEYACTDDGLEDNDESDSATQVDLPYMQTDLIAMVWDYEERDNDWFAFRLAAGEAVNIQVAFSHEHSDIDIRLFDYPASNSSYDSVAYSTSSTDNEEINYKAEADGVFYLQVKTLGNYKCTSYDIDISFLVDPCLATPCTGEHEECIWNPGEDPDYSCDCEDGYERNDEEICVPIPETR